MIRRLWKSLRRAYAAHQRSMDRASTFRVIAESAGSVEGAKATMLIYMTEDPAWAEWFDERALEDLAESYAQCMTRE